MLSREELIEAIRRVVKADPKDLSQCLQEVREQPHQEDCKFKRIFIVLDSDSDSDTDSDTATKTKRSSKKPKLSNNISISGPAQSKPADTENSSCTLQPASHQDTLPSEPLSAPFKDHESTTRCPNLPPIGAAPNHSSPPCPLAESNDSPVDQPSNSSTGLKDKLKKRLSEVRQLTLKCPCELHSQYISDEDFRIKDIQNEAVGLNAFKASLAYMSLALEFHEYEVQLQRGDISLEPRLSRKGEYKPSNKRSKHTAKWIDRKGFKQPLETTRKQLACGQKMCLTGARIADEMGLESGSFIPIMMRTFMSRIMSRISWTNLNKSIPSLIDDDEVRQLAILNHNWLNICNTVYHKRDGLPRDFQHTCGITNHESRNDHTQRIDSESVRALVRSEAEQPGPMGELTNSAGLRVLQSGTSTTALYDAGESKILLHVMFMLS